MGAVYSKGKGVLSALPFQQEPRIKVGYGACGIAAGAQEVYDRIVGYVKEKKIW